MNMPVYFSPAYNGTSIAFDTFRKADAIAASLRVDPIPGVELREPRPVDRAELLRVHDSVYVDAILTGEPRDLASSQELGWDAGLAVAVCASTGGVRDAALHALATGGVAGSLSSGLHHAHAARGYGFCTVNGLVVAARAALDAGARRVLVLDLDAHCGGGTAELIAGVEGVEQVDVSVWHFDEYLPSSQARLVFAHAEDYLVVVESAIAAIADPAGIDLVLYNAGMDPHRWAGGLIGIDDDMMRRREAMVFAWAETHRLPVAWVLAGGYTGAHLDAAGLVALHRLTIEAACRHVRPANLDNGDDR